MDRDVIYIKSATSPVTFRCARDAMLEERFLRFRRLFGSDKDVRRKAA